MSVNSTVASIRLDSGRDRTPVKNSSISPRTASVSPIQGRWSSPVSSTNEALGIRSARYRPAPTGMTRSPDRCKTSVGTRIVERIGRTSISAFIRVKARTAPGLAPCRM